MTRARMPVCPACDFARHWSGADCFLVGFIIGMEHTPQRLAAFQRRLCTRHQARINLFADIRVQVWGELEGKLKGRPAFRLIKGGK